MLFCHIRAGGQIGSFQGMVALAIYRYVPLFKASALHPRTRSAIGRVPATKLAPNPSIAVCQASGRRVTPGSVQTRRCRGSARAMHTRPTCIFCAWSGRRRWKAAWAPMPPRHSSGVEMAVAQSVDPKIVHSPAEAKMLREAEPRVPVGVVPWTVRPKQTPPG